MHRPSSYCMWLSLALCAVTAQRAAAQVNVAPSSAAVAPSDDLAPPKALIARGSAELAAGRVDDAIVDLEAAAEKLRNAPDLRNLDERYYSLGTALSLLGSAKGKKGSYAAALGDFAAAHEAFKLFIGTESETWQQLLLQDKWVQRANGVLRMFDDCSEVASAAKQWRVAVSALNSGAAFAETLGEYGLQRARLAKVEALYQSHPDLSDALLSRTLAIAGQGLAFANEGRPDDALTTLHIAEAMLAKAPCSRECSRQRAKVESFIAVALQGKGDHKSAVPHLLQAVVTLRELGDEPKLLVNCLDRLFGSYFALNDLVEAASALRQKLTALEATKDGPEQYDTYDKLVVAYGASGNIVQAAETRKTAEKLAESLDLSDARRSKAAANYGVVLSDAGDCAGALVAFQQASDLLKSVPALAEQRARYAIDIARRLSCLHRAPTEIDAAIAAGAKNAPAGESGDAVRAALRILGASLADERGAKGQEAAACRREMLKLSGREDATNTLLGCWVEIGHDEHRLGHYDKAISSYQAAAGLLKVHSAANGKFDEMTDDPRGAGTAGTILANQMAADVASGKYQDALLAAKAILGQARPAQLQNMLRLKTFERQLYMARHGSTVVASRVVALPFLSPLIEASEGWSVSLEQKGLFSSIGRIANAAALEGGADAKADWRKQLALRQRVARLVGEWQDQGDDRRDRNNSDQVLKLYRASDSIEDRMTARVAAKLDVEAWHRADPKQLVARLRSQDVLVEVVRFRPIDVPRVKQSVEALFEDGTGAEHYGAFIAVGRTGAVQALDLGASAPIDALASQYRETLETQRATGMLDEAALSIIGLKLSKLVVTPVLSRAPAASRLYFVPEGALAVVPLEALPVSIEGANIKYLVETMEVVYLSSGRDLIPSSPKTQSVDAWFVGDPAFDATAAQLKTGLGDVRSTAPVQRARGQSKSTGRWGSLPETVEFLRRGASAANTAALRPRFLSGTAASEGSVLQIVQPRVLVFATHGTFRRASPVVKTTLTSLTLGGPEGNTMEGEGASPHAWRAADPLMRSIIVLAGANKQSHAPQGDVGNDLEPGDGALTAYEVWGMDLRGTDLVIMAACESGVGVVQSPDAKDKGFAQPTGEVVAGFRQAFQVAGARSLVSSLWEVPLDETTAQMSELMEEWLTKGQPKYQSFHTAQLSALTRARNKRRTGHPLWWAGFVYLGEAGDRPSAVH